MKQSARADEAVLKAALGGDREAQLRLVALLDPVIRGRVRRYLSRRRTGRLAGLDADDLVQAVWLDLWERDGRGLRRFDSSRGRLLAYIGQFARRSLWLRARCASRAPQATRLLVEPPCPSAGQEQRLVAADLLDRTRRWFAETGDRGTWRTLCEIHVEGTPRGVVAARMGISRQAVYSLEHRARVRARAYAC